LKKEYQESYTRKEIADRLTHAADFMSSKSAELRALGREEAVCSSWSDMSLAAMCMIAELCGPDYLPEDMKEIYNDQ
tara:strand:+ start:1036 stop:1266 length:231 start_codon:yes stop_codon:yes gene_type:complete